MRVLVALIGGCAWMFLAGSAFGEEAQADYLQATAKDMAWWRDARFGLFVHWGPVSLVGTEISWSRGGPRPGWGRDSQATGPIPVEVYDNLYKQFRPYAFNADQWVAMAKAAGMKYIVFTTKHHDGFCMFDSALTDYKITNSPLGRDVVAELAEACHKHGLRLGFYYSPPDWHHPDCCGEHHERYVEYMHGQLRELCTNYGKVDIIWFDGLGSTAEMCRSEEMLKMIRELQPHVLINNRAGLPGDFSTPEQHVGAFSNTRPWESCITIATQWAWKPNDRTKSLSECIRTLVGCAGGDGNLLFNVGPMYTGAIEPLQVERLEEMGAWLRKYGKTVYGTRGGPYMPTLWCASTHKGRNLYLHVFEWDGDRFELPPIDAKVRSARLLTGGCVDVAQTDEGITVVVAPEHQDAIDTIVALRLDRPADELKPCPAAPSLAYGKPVTTSNVHKDQPEYAGAKAVDGDNHSRWATDGGTHQAWLEVDLEKPTTFNRVVIDESCGSRIQSFQLQRKAGEEWETFFTGTTVGAKWHQRFEPVTAQHVRLNILEATEGPTIWEFQLFNTMK